MLSHRLEQRRYTWSDLVDAVQHGDVKVKPAAEFAKVTPPLDQQRLIAEHGSPAAAVKATVKAKADRADKKEPRKVPDPKPAADRAEARTGPDDVGTHRQRVDQLHAMLKAFAALEKLGNPGQLAEAVKRVEVDDKSLTMLRLRRVAVFAAAVANIVSGKPETADCGS